MLKRHLDNKVAVSASRPLICYARVAVLFARSDSIYKSLENCDVYDAERDALTFSGDYPVIAHPPCRAWGRLRHFAKPRSNEKELALWAVDIVRKNGGVLEHPAHSTLWKEKPLPLQGEFDKWRGWTLGVSQFWFGHRADKKTWLYICGIEPKDVPPIPFRLGRSECVIRLDKRRADGTHIRKGDGDWRQPLGQAEREGTPLEFARWLIELASKTRRA